MSAEAKPDAEWLEDWRLDGALLSLLLNGYMERRWNESKGEWAYFTTRPYREGDDACCPFCNHPLQP